MTDRPPLRERLLREARRLSVPIDMVELDCGLSYVLAAVLASEGLNVITPWDQPFAICAHNPDEALDVLVVTPGADEREKLEESAETERARFFRRFGRSLSVHCLAQTDLAEPWSPFVVAAAGEGILLFGTDLAALRLPHG